MTDLVPLLIITAACAGYLFCDICLRYKYIFPREDGQRFYIRTIAYGFPFAFITLISNEILFLLPEHTNLPVIFQLAKVDGAFYAAFFALFFAWAAAHTFNWIIGENGRFKYYSKAMLADDFDAVLYRSTITYQPVAVTLENRKVYVGLVADTFEPSNDAKSYLTILPLLSGYRAQDTLKFEIAATYNPVLELLNKQIDGAEHQTSEELEAYFVSFLKSKIISLHLFNDHLYDHVNNQYGKQSSRV